MKQYAPAKLNRFLGVLGKRADGFHELELVTTVLDEVPDLTDTLWGETAETFSLELVGDLSDGLSAGEDNLVVRAWRLLEQEAGRSLGASLRLEKRIPHGAGLGGGSSDGAAALKLGNALFALGLPTSTLLRLGAQLGSDVPLFVLGGTTLGLGRGERVYPLRPIPLEPMVLVYPGLHVSTPSVYRGLSGVGYPTPEPCPSLAEGLPPPWRNDLTESALWVCPSLQEVRAALLETGGEPLLCGSGSCWAAVYPDPELRDEACQKISAMHSYWKTWRIGRML